MEYIPGDPMLIKNIVTKFKSQGIFDQIRKECIADVDTKPAYQNLCHRADNQVSKFLSKVKWGPDLHKNQTRENIRRQINDCSFVEPGIAIIVDQLVNPRINTEIVPRVEEMLYKFLGIPVENIQIHRETKNDRNSSRNVSDCEIPGISSREMYDKRRDSEERYRMDNQKNNGISTFRNDSSMNKMQLYGDKYGRDQSSGVKIDPFDALLREPNKSIKSEPEKHPPKPDFKTSPFSDFDSDSSDDEMSPPFEPHVKSDNDMSIGSGDSNFSEIIDTRPPNEPEIPGVDDQIEDLCKLDGSKIITEHDDSLDSVQSSYSTAPEPDPEPSVVPASDPVPEPEPDMEPLPPIIPAPVPDADPEPEKVHISPIEIPKTPTINYETSDDSDDYVKNKKLLDNVALESAESLEVPEVNFDKIVERVIEDNTDSKALEMAEIKPPKDEKKYDDKNRPDDPKKKTPTKHKDDKSAKPVENKDKVEKKTDYRSDKDRKYDKHRSEGRSKDREKEKPKHDSSKIHTKKDDKSHHSRDHSKSDYDRKSKTEHKKDDKKDSGRSDHKKDDRGDHKKDAEHRKDPRTDRKKEDDKKHSRDDKDRKRDPHKTSSSDDRKSSKPKMDESKHKYPDKPRDDKKGGKNGDHHKSKKKSEDPKKSRSHCNLDEKKKTDRRSSDRDSSGPSTSNSSSLHHASSQHSSKSEKDKGSGKHRHSSSSSSHKTKRNDSEHDKNRSEKHPNDHEKNGTAEDDLEMILESSPDKGFPNSVKSEVNFSARDILANQDQSNDHIEDMMNEMFQPTKPVLKKPKIAKNFADIRRIMKLRKLYEEDSKLKECQEQNANESITDADKSTVSKIKLRKTVDYFVMRRFGKNGNNLEKCKELTNAIIETLTDVKLNITRVDRRYSLVDGSCTLSNDENCLTLANSIQDEKMNAGAKSSDSEDIENIPLIEDERANLILEDLANSYTDPNFKLGNIPSLSDDPLVDKSPQLEEEPLKIVQFEIKANGAKTILPAKLAPPENDDKSNLVEDPSTKMKSEEDDSNPGLKLKIKSISDGKNTTWQACDQPEQIQDPVHYLPLPEYNSGFMQYVNGLLNEEYDFEVQNLSVEIEDYSECYDFMFANFLGAKVVRPKPDDAKTSPIKYNSQIITKKSGDKSILLRIKKSSESEDFSSTAVVEQKILNRKRKLADDSGVELDPPEMGKDEVEPVKKRKKTLGIKRSFVNPLKMKLTSGQFNDTPGNNCNLIENVTIAVKSKNSPVPRKKAKINKIKEMAAANANHKKSESESSDGRRSSVSSSGTSSTHSKGINESALAPASSPAPSPAPPKNKKNTTLNDSKADTIETNTIEGPTTTKTMTDPPPPSKKPIDTRTAEEKRKQIIMKSYYDESDLYKPRPSLRLTSRRYRLGNTENT